MTPTTPDQHVYEMYTQIMGLAPVMRPNSPAARVTVSQRSQLSSQSTWIAEGGPAEDDAPLYKTLSPKRIKAHLDRYVIGQDSAKRALAVAANTHLKRMVHQDDSRQIGKSNLLMIGDTGVGKTLLVSRLAELMDVPFVIEDVNQISQEGYVGRSVSDILNTLLHRAGGNLEKASFGIVFLDEIDKIAQRGEGIANGDISTKAVQDGLLKMVEGADFELQGRSMLGGQMQTLGTHNILFIAGGAFAGIDKIVEKRQNKTNGVGFNARVGVKRTVDKTQAYQSVIIDDLVKFGLTPEFCGRMHHITRLHDLDRETLIRIMKEPDDSVLKQYVKRFALDGITLTLTPPSLVLIADRCIEHKTGARGLMALLEHILNDAQFDLPGGDQDVLKVTKEYVEKKLECISGQ